jgi:hypothetical protein
MRLRLQVALQGFKAPLLPRCRCHVQWLGLKAFERVLARKQSAYGEVLAAVRQQLRAPQYRHLPSQLAAVVDPARSSAFDEIRY